MRLFFTFLILVSFSSLLQAQSATPVRKAELPAPLEEISGMIHLNGKLYGIEDGGNLPIIYEFDSTSGVISKTVTLEAITNTDWEDITHDGTYIYIGDFGNNSNGNRTNLRFRRFPIASINAITEATGTIPSADIETINFAYEDQTDFTATGNNNTAFDCEAVIYYNGYLHLFTKNWVTGTNTVHYRVQIPATPTATVLTAERLEEFDTDDIMITSATMMNNQIIALLGYNNPDVFGAATRCAVWLVGGYTDINTMFTTASDMTKIDLGPVATIPIEASNGQMESITSVNQTSVLIANERRVVSTIVFPQRLHQLDLISFISQSLLPFGIENFTSRLTDNQVLLTWEYNEPGAAYFEVEAANSATGSYSYMGKVYSNPTGGTYSFTDNNLGNSAVKYYRIKIVTPDGKNHYSKTLQVKKDESKLFNLVAMPSPFTSSLNISFYSDTDQVIQLSVVDIQGRPVKTRQLQTNRGRYNFTLDELHGLSKGVYFLTARTKTDLFVRKVLKQ